MVKGHGTSMVTACLDYAKSLTMYFSQRAQGCTRKLGHTWILEKYNEFLLKSLMDHNTEYKIQGMCHHRYLCCLDGVCLLLQMHILLLPVMRYF